MTYQPLNAATRRTLKRITNAGPSGLPISKIDMLHLNRLNRRGLVAVVGQTSNLYADYSIRAAG